MQKAYETVKTGSAAGSLPTSARTAGSDAAGSAFRAAGEKRSRARKERALTETDFDRLLACLDADRERAAVKYLDLFQALVSFFAFRGATDPFAHADETFDRVARRLADGQRITTPNPASYFYAVARNVWREALARPAAATIPLHDDCRPEHHLVPDPEALLVQDEERSEREAQMKRLAACLDELAAEDRALLVEYYEGAGSARISHRQALAARYGITIKTLRNRACQLRARIADRMTEGLTASCA
jgi:RNA polymerase sigma factor (sigma-70 family)